MVELTDQQLKKLQRVELDLLKEFDRICRKNGIKYSITGGTLLGAVRHGGFIPWDDDADVSMLRTEYEKFVDVCESEIDQTRYYFQDIDRTEGYRWGYGKLRRKDSLFLREHQEHMPYEQGIFLDIFPRDSVPDGCLSERFHKFRCFIVRKILWSEVGRYAEKNKIKRGIFALLSTLTRNNFKHLYHALLNSSRNPKTNRVRALTFPTPHKEKGYLREWYAEYEDIMFEGYPLMVERGYRDWLELEFHNYMELPPESKRKCHPVVDIRFPREEVL